MRVVIGPCKSDWSLTGSVVNQPSAGDKRTKRPVSLTKCILDSGQFPRNPIDKLMVAYGEPAHNANALLKWDWRTAHARMAIYGGARSVGDLFHYIPGPAQCVASLDCAMTCHRKSITI